jgi:predicted signal transduction protein with EAL and GGDEF domain
MSGCRGTDLIGSVNTVPMRLASPKSFIDGLGEDAVKDAILRLIVDFSHTLGLKVTAEGVENGRQVANLRPSVGAIRPKVHIKAFIPADALLDQPMCRPLQPTIHAPDACSLG